MNELKKLLVCALGLTVVVALGCDVDPECDEAGVCADAGEAGGNGGEGAAGGVGGEGGVADVVFDTLLLFDDGSMDDGNGTTGADFCGVKADCASPTSATLTQGGGSLCEAEGPGCAADRTDANAILDDGSDCDAGSAPSDYVSVGGDGSIAVEFDNSLAGCEVTVIEFAGATQEAWSAFVCDGANLDNATCVNNDAPVHEAAAGGEATFTVPAE